MPGTFDPSETDVDRDDKEALSRPTGGEPDPDLPPDRGTTDPSPSGTFVGRVAGQDEGYAERTGAEARAEADEEPGG